MADRRLRRPSVRIVTRFLITLDLNILLLAALLLSVSR